MKNEWTKLVRMATLPVFAVAAAWRAGCSPTDGNEDRKDTQGVMRWLAPNAEKQWETILNTPVENGEASIRNRKQFVGGGVVFNNEEILKAFGKRYMPKAYAQYQDAYTQSHAALEIYLKGLASEQTGEEMSEKTLHELMLRALRRRDELCFFLLFHQAGIFSDKELAKYDSRPISIHLAPESDDWPDDTPKAIAALSTEVSTCAAKYLPKTLSGYQRLCGLFDEGAKQYAELRRTALALGTARARRELLMLKGRLEEIRTTLEKYQRYFSFSSGEFEAYFGDKLAEQDQSNAVEIQKYEREMEVKAYVARVARILVVTLPGGATMEMAWCPPGSFEMGRADGPGDGWLRYEDEHPIHEVTLTKGFWIGKYEVTQAQWKSVMGNNRSRFEGDNRPVENVSWNDCQEFCKKTGLQLPTEAQWEYACRAGSTGPFAWTGPLYERILKEMGWYSKNSEDETHPVGMKLPNAWGLYDMHGNVMEWCADWAGPYHGDAVTDPQGPPSGSERMIRGGSWRSGDDCCTSAWRGSGHPSDMENFVGFRVVKTLSE